jgi:tetratricopeptide (TPR) repeat protein
MQSISSLMVLALFCTGTTAHAANDAPAHGSCGQLNGAALEHASRGQLADAESMVAAGDPSQGACAGVVMHNLSRAMLALGRFRDAERLAGQSIQILEKVYPADNCMLLRPLHTLASILMETGKIQKAREAIERTRRLQITRSEDAAVVHLITGVLRQLEGRLSEAEAEYQIALRAMDEAGLGESADAASILDSLASLYLRQQRLYDARPALERSYSIYRRAKDVFPIDRVKFLGLRGVLHARAGEWPQSEEDFREALSTADRQPSVDPAILRLLLTNYSYVLRKNHHGAQARAVEARKAALPPARATTVVDYADLLFESTHRKH